jgi:hypothetical protein
MKPVSWKIIVGLLLFVVGALALLNTLGVLPIEGKTWDILLPACFLAGGVVFLYVLISSKKNWWASIPAFTLIGLGLLIGSSLFMPGFEEYSAAIFLAFIGIGFWVIYFLDLQKWWAIIPGGALVSVGALVATGWVSLLFLGLALTFALLWILPNRGKRMTWPWIPAGVLAVMGCAFLWEDVGGRYMNYIMPALFVAAGLALILYTVFRKK